MLISKSVKIFSIATITCCLLLGALITKLYNTSQLSNAAFQQEMALTSLAAELSISSTELTKLVRVYAVTENPEAETAYMAVVTERSGQIPRKANRKVAPGEKVALTDLMILHGGTKEELAKVTLANQLSNDLIALETEAMNAVKGLFKDDEGEYTVQDTPNPALAVNLVYSDTYEEELVKIQAPLLEFFTMLTARTTKATAEARQSVAQDIILLGLTIGLVLILVVLFALWSRFKICAPLDKVSEYVAHVSHGDLKKEPPAGRACEIGILTGNISIMVKNLVELIDKADEKTEEAEVAIAQAKAAAQETQKAHAEEAARHEKMVVAAHQLEGVVQVTSVASSQLATKIEQSAQGAEQQALRVTNAAAAVEEMNNVVLEVARSAESAATISADTRKKAEEGSLIVRDCMIAINSLESSASILKDDMGTLAGHAQAISQIMSVISDIADQTNLLALNAAIEAARAGDAGRGFAVVADEVRKLAEKTMASTTDVGAAISAIQQSTDASMKQVEDTVQNVSQATDLAEQCGQALLEIVNLAEATASQVQGIATASSEQSATSEEITISMNEVSAIAEKTTQAMSEASHAVDDLSAQTQQLTMLIDDMK